MISSYFIKKFVMENEICKYIIICNHGLKVKNDENGSPTTSICIHSPTASSSDQA